MVLITCPECSKEVSDQAKTCPHRGFEDKERIYQKELEKKKRSFTSKQVLGAIVVLIIFGAIISNMNTSGYKPVTKKKPLPTLTQEQKTQAINSIKNVTEVKDAAIKQKGKTLSFAITVRHGISKIRAKSLGNKFVNMISNQGIYDCLIVVVSANGQKIINGAKSCMADHITWY